MASTKLMETKTGKRFWKISISNGKGKSKKTTRFYWPTKKFGERYSVKNFHPHKLRHSSASIALTNGADVVSVSERLGHSDTAVTLRMYAHANEESIRRAEQTVRDALKAKNE